MGDGGNGGKWGTAWGNGGRPDLRDFPLISTQVDHAGQAVPISPTLVV